MKILFWMSSFLLFYAMVGYPITLIIIDKILNRKNNQDYTIRPSVSMIISVYNEEKVIEKKLSNILDLNYDKLEIIIANDCSNDKTIEICKKFISNHPEANIKIKTANKHYGKTNAQNEAVRIATGDLLVFSDANSMFKHNAIDELASYFTSEDIEYVTGSLIYCNEEYSNSVIAENTYWNFELKIRKIESNIKTITAGNGAIYACWKKDYRDYGLIASHDYAMPLHAGLNKKRALYNPKAIAYEKASTTTTDEFKRKVRMQRNILNNLFTNLERLNIFKYGWFSFFHFNHRTLRYLQALLHILIFISNIFLIQVNNFYMIIFVLQNIFYVLAFLGFLMKTKMKIFYYPMYYTMMMIAEIRGTINQILGNTKATWDKAETTR